MASRGRTLTTREDSTRAVALRRRLLLGTLTHVAASGAGSTPRLIDDVCQQLGVTSRMFRSLYPSDADFFAELDDLLVEECRSRLSEAVERFRPGDGDRFVAAAVALAEARPLTRSGMTVRASRRLRALADPRESIPIASAERRYALVLQGAFEQLMARLGRRFAWPVLLAVRVILDTYERSFELWILEGHDEHAFAGSPYVRRTLPRLLLELSEAAAQ